MADAPPTPEETVAAVRKTDAETRKLLAEAKQAELNALIPALPADLPSGKVDASPTGSAVSGVATYQALKTIAASIAADVSPDYHRIWLVPDGRVHRHETVAREVEAQLGRVDRCLDAAKESLPDPGAKPKAESLALALGLAASALPALASLFRTDVTIRTRDVPITFTALAAAVTYELLTAADRTVCVSEISGGLPNDFTDRVTRLEEKRDRLQGALTMFKATFGVLESEARVAREQADALKAAIGGLTDSSKLNGFLEPMAEQLNAAADAEANLSTLQGIADLVSQAVEASDTFLTQLRTPDSAGVPPLALVSDYLGNKGAHVLILEASFSAGETQYESGAFYGPHALHTGALVISWMLLDADGNAIKSGIEHQTVSAKTDVRSADVDWS